MPLDLLFCFCSLVGFSESDNADTWLCNADNFSPTKWLTQGRRRSAELPHCPLAGEWAGVLPDAEGLCARSYADCNNPEVMFYNVFSCRNESEVYEEREYRCFGTWTEGGLVYTYAERRDLPGNECFVGEETGVDTNVVTEAGANCERGHQPRRYGMTLTRQGKCNAPPPAYNNEQEEELEEMLREEEGETNRSVSPRLRTTTSKTTSLDWPSDKVEQHHKKHHRHHNRDRDILTNEIAGSSSSSSSASFSSRSSAVWPAKAMQVLTSVLAVFVWTVTYGTRTTWAKISDVTEMTHIQHKKPFPFLQDSFSDWSVSISQTTSWLIYYCHT